MQKQSKANNGIRYILLVVEVLSNYIWVRPLKSKRATDVSMAFEYLLTKEPEGGGMPCPPTRLQTDEGTEFISLVFKNLMVRYNIIHFWSHSRDVKASVGM